MKEKYFIPPELVGQKCSIYYYGERNIDLCIYCNSGFYYFDRYGRIVDDLDLRIDPVKTKREAIRIIKTAFDAKHCHEHRRGKMIGIPKPYSPTKTDSWRTGLLKTISKEARRISFELGKGIGCSTPYM